MVTVNPTEILFSSINVAILSRPTMEFLPTRCLSCNSWNTSLEVSRNRTLELDQFMMALQCIQLYRMNLYDNKPQVACPYHQITSSSRQLLHGHNNILLTQVWKGFHLIKSLMAPEKFLNPSASQTMWNILSCCIQYWKNLQDINPITDKSMTA